MKKDLSVYIHIPFCKKKCNYCDFCSITGDKKLQQDYVGALIYEIKSQAYMANDYNIKTVFIGGGTPSILDENLIEEILFALSDSFEHVRRGSYVPEEITVECNPGTVTYEKLSSYKKAGVNRLSFGLQSANDDELKLLGRIHTFSEWEESMRLAIKCGFDNINTDIISGIPGQTKESFAATISKVMAYEPEHISIYSLIIEEGTPFYDLYNPERLSDDELDAWEENDRQIYGYTRQILEEYGYDRYEISNYSRPGYECIHNNVYWTRGDYIGFGVSAASLIDNKRYNHTRDIREYIQNQDMYMEESLDIYDQMSEYMMLGLRTIKGVSISDFRDTFHEDIEEVFHGVTDKWINEGMMVLDGDRLYLTEAGLDICNMILVDFFDNK